MMIYCPKCMEAAARVSVDLFTQDDHSREFTCYECDSTFNTFDIEKLLDAATKWRQVLAWVGTMPTNTDAAPTQIVPMSAIQRAGADAHHDAN